MAQKKPLRVGVVSANWGMIAHLPAWQVNGVEVAAVCTSREETARAAATKYGIERYYWNVAEMAADPTLDIIDVGTRPDLRRDMVLSALGQGKHVLAAANFAADLDSARAMRDAARQAGRVAMLDSTLAVIPAHRQVKAMIDRGSIGRVVAINARLQISLFAGEAQVGNGWRWFGTKSHGASAMRNLGTHALHLLTELLGPVESVTAQQALALSEWRFPDGTTQRPEVNDTAQLMLRFTNGTIGTLSVGWATPALAGWAMQIDGETGTLVTRADGAWFPTTQSVEMFCGAGAQPLAALAVDPAIEPAPFIMPPNCPPQADDIARLIRRFAAAIDGRNTAPQPDFERAFHVEAVLDAAERASTDQAWIKPDIA